MQAYPFAVVFIVTSQQILAHAPVASLDIYALSVDINVQHRIAHGIRLYTIFIFLDAEPYAALIAHFSVDERLQLTGVKVGLAISVGPPQTGIVYDEADTVSLTDVDDCSVAALHPDTLCEGDVARRDDTLNRNSLRLA